MSSTLEEFRARAKRLHGGRSFRGCRYGAELRALAVRYGLEQQQAGRRIEDAAAELGIHVRTLWRWLGEKPSFRPVAVKGSGSSGSYVVVTPDGFRVEGVAREDVAEVLERLR